MADELHQDIIHALNRFTPEALANLSRIRPETAEWIGGLSDEEQKTAKKSFELARDVQGFKRVFTLICLAGATVFGAAKGFPGEFKAAMAALSNLFGGGK